MRDENEKRVATGIEGFDEMAEGGLPSNSINILSGRAGSGKTLFSIHFAVEGARRGENTIFVSVDDRKDAVLRAAKQYDLKLEEAINSGKVRLYDYESLKDKTGQGLVDFDDLTRTIDQLVAPTEAERIVLDSIAGLGIAEDSVNEIRRSMLRFIRRVRENDVTGLFVTEKWEGKLTRYGVEEYVGDSLIVLGLEQMQNQMSRSINIRKMRFTDHDTSFRPIEITPKGLVVHKQGQVF
ncbi:MAG: ATPase domain-containing protein [Halobacteria archaeon]|nr:ATPase domain-containing protein [Halobacteria archaeon]